VLGMMPIDSGSLLEIGCAGGFFLDEARRRGFDPCGIEINGTMAAHASESLGCRVISSRIEDIPEERFRGEFDAVVMMDVLEHVPRPRLLIEKVSGWLRKTGVVVIRGPIANRRTARLKVAARMAFWIEKRLEGYPLDANTFSKRSLMRLFEQFGDWKFSWVGETRRFANLIAQRQR
jgi:2-polyprenyl-3-methyl-5-hydroxy-6-metoxy-1,4-benzoquinol methylase